MKKEIILFILTTTFLWAQEKPSDEVAAAVANATNPLAFITKLQVQPNHTWKDNNASQINVTSRIVHQQEL